MVKTIEELMNAIATQFGRTYIAPRKNLLFYPKEKGFELRTKRYDQCFFKWVSLDHAPRLLLDSLETLEVPWKEGRFKGNTKFKIIDFGSEGEFHPETSEYFLHVGIDERVNKNLEKYKDRNDPPFPLILPNPYCGLEVILTFSSVAEGC